MTKSLSFGWRGWIIGLLLPWLAGCSALQLGYDQGPRLAYWWLDGYADFTAEQRPRVEHAVDAWFDWHRATQLPDYAQALAGLRSQVAGDVSAAQLCGLYAGWQRRAERAFDHAVPALAELVPGLEPAQLAHIERRFADNLDDAAHTVAQPQDAERRRAAYERVLSRAETLYGRLDAAQQRALAESLAASPFDAERWLGERRLRQQEILRSLRQWLDERADAAVIRAGLRRLAAEALRSPRADYRDHQQQVVDANCAIAARLHNGTTAAQRRHAGERLAGWADDLRALAARP